MSVRQTPEIAEGRWQRLARRNVLAGLVLLAGVPVAAGAVLLFAGSFLPQGVLITLAIFAAIGVAIGVFVLWQWWTTFYRVTEERFELRTGLAFRRHKSIPRDRIRSVDVTADPAYRIFGLTKVRVGTGQHGSGELTLEGIGKLRGDRLRRLLLERPRVHGAKAAAEPVASPRAPIARLDWAWIRYAPLTVWTFFGAGIVTGALYKPLDAVGLEPWRWGIVLDAWQSFRSYPLWLGIGVVVIALAIVGALGSLLLFVEAWWGYRLDREPGGTFRVRRGLLTTRSISLEEGRLRGIELSEPMLLRWAGAAQVKAVATGLGTKEEKEAVQKNVLSPPMPLAEAHRVAADVLNEKHDPASPVRLRSHPRVALRRRLLWFLAPVAVLVALLAALGVIFAWMPGWIWIAALVLFPVAALYAIDAYRNLAHGTKERYLLTRSGTFVRRTVALRRDGVIGWTLRRSPSQRRAGLATLTAATAAGKGAYRARDVETSEGLAFAEEAVPGLMAPFIERG